MLGTVIWVKNAASMGWQDFRARHEPILFACTEGEGRCRVDDRTATTVWEVDREAAGGYLHPTTKPVALVVRAMTLCCPAGATVYEPFSGSGTTIIACEQLGRKCRAIEISPAYVAVALERWATATGKAPVLTT
jgi:DNA modification methylase